jgi:hypothetical protein
MLDLSEPPARWVFRPVRIDLALILALCSKFTLSSEFTVICGNLEL